MDAEISREGVPTGASGYGAGTKNVSEIHDSGIGGIKPPSDASSPPPGLPTGVDPARETKENIPTGAEDVFEPRPNPAEDEEKPTINPASSFMETGGPEFFTGGLDPTSAPVQGNFKTHSTYNDIPVPYGNPSAALPPETSHTLIAPVLESLNQAGAPNAHIQHVEQVIYSADGVPGIGHVEGTIERLTTVDQTPNMPPRIQSGFVKPAEEASNGQKSSMRSE
ncbi:hypothetical protein QYM36_006320 [Artemia franciscana]|nr:hypothetical protein QYM36_006320 [Artemia franciscana]KAK2717500.1 hypothetical protein QYM36_006320 [Artemia franciscana]